MSAAVCTIPFEIAPFRLTGAVYGTLLNHRSALNELGGKADDPQPVPTMGWFATGTDTEGNVIGLWQNDPNAA